MNRAWLANTMMLCALALIGACEKEEADGGGTPDAGDESATFTEVYAIIEARCGGGNSGCHVGDDGEFSGGLDLHDQASAYTSLVGVAATSEDCEGEGEMRVIPNNAEDSQLIKVFEDRACVGRMPPRGMPPERMPLSMEEISVFRSWIEAGAMND